MEKEAKILVAGAYGMVGSAIVRELQNQGYDNILVPSHDELDLINQADVEEYFRINKPEYVIDAAAKVGGIKANNEQMADFLMNNLMIQNNIIICCHKYNVKKFLFLASACIYPKNCEQPIKEESLLTGALEPTNEGYALAKIAGLRACEYYKKQYGDNFIAVMPANAYGINDSFDVNNSHVIPALIQRFHEAKTNNVEKVTMWGTGTPKREFLYVDDLANACLFLMNNYDGDTFINVGNGIEVTMAELADIIKEVVGYNGIIEYDVSKPDGMMRRIVDSSRINNLGWKAKTSLQEGIRCEYQWFLDNIEK